ncbi:hypothetical protein VNO78_28861 [Psophocarpus tetragonolobus]|uniref:F-box protein GID2 n=1 Tax=Psophocarpus tetragonolobus TaxID=3891 RepID=A0AAN9WZ60_PSOTE
MKRRVSEEEGNKRKRKRGKGEEEEGYALGETRGSVYLDDNVLFEVLKHVDARSLAMAGCVSKQWNKTAQDERLWELICTNHWPNTPCGEQQLRSVVLALGGFRRLHALYLWPLSKSNPHAPSPSSWPAIPHVLRSKPRWGKDEVHLSLSLLSIRYYEKMNFHNTKKHT